MVASTARSSARCRLCLAGSKTLQRLLALMRRQLARPTKANTTRLGPLAAFIGTSPDQMPLKRGEPGQDRDHKFAVRRRGIGQASCSDLNLAPALATASRYSAGRGSSGLVDRAG